MRLFPLLLAILLLVGVPPAFVAAQQPVGQIVFGGPYGLWIIGSDGKNEQLLQSGPGADMPAVSPDGKQVIYVINGTPEAGAWLYDLTTNQRQQISREPWRWPTWSPDGRFLAFTLPSGLGSNLVVYDLQARAGRALTVDGLNEAPGWWRDGSRLLFSRNGELWVIRADGGEAGPVRGTAGQTVLQAAWSPDGLKLAYLAVAKDRNFTDPDAPTQIWIATSEGNDGQYILQGNIDRTQRISWSPDSTRLAYATFTGAGSDIYTIYATGGDSLRLSDGRNPVWRPVTPADIRPVTVSDQPCAIQPERIFATAFARQPSARTRIGCPTDFVSSAEGAFQTFDNGFMYYRDVPAGTTVWVFFSDGTWVAGDPRPGTVAVPPVAPPPGKIVPRNAFYNVWLAMGGPASRIGFAIDQETNFPSDAQPYERGLAFGGNNRVVFVNINGTYEVVLTS